MEDKNNTPPITRHSSDTMKEADDSTTNAINIPDKMESEKIPADGACSNVDKSMQEQKEEKKGSINDYFVSRQVQHSTVAVG